MHGDEYDYQISYRNTLPNVFGFWNETSCCMELECSAIPNKLENRFLVLVLPYLACSLVIYFQSSSLSICVEKDL